MQAQVTPNMKPTQITGPALPTKGRSQKEEGIQPSSLGKGDLRRRKLGKKKDKTEIWCRWRNKAETHQIKSCLVTNEFNKFCFYFCFYYYFLFKEIYNWISKYACKTVLFWSLLCLNPFLRFYIMFSFSFLESNLWCFHGRIKYIYTNEYKNLNFVSLNLVKEILDFQTSLQTSRTGKMYLAVIIPVFLFFFSFLPATPSGPFLWTSIDLYIFYFSCRVKGMCWMWWATWNALWTFCSCKCFEKAYSQ